MANHALALLLAWNRGVVTMDRQVHAGVWGGRVPGSRTGALHGETVGIVGLGNIGSAFARRVAALETKVIACDPYVDDKRFAALGVERVSLEVLAERADYVSVHTLLNAETRHLIGEAFFGRMKPTAILINTSRGPVVDEQALGRALRDEAPRRRGARRVGGRAGGCRQSAAEDGQRHRHAARRLFLVSGGGADTRALWRGDRARAHRPAAAQRRKPRNLRVGGGAPRPLTQVSGDDGGVMAVRAWALGPPRGRRRTRARRAPSGRRPPPPALARRTRLQVPRGQMAAHCLLVEPFMYERAEGDEGELAPLAAEMACDAQVVRRAVR